MKNAYPIAIVVVATAFSAALLAAPVSSMAQAPNPLAADDEADTARARQIAERFEANARVLTVFDRQGNVITTVGERAIYSDPVFSPDGKRLAVIKRDLEKDNSDVWVLDVATGEETRLTSNAPGEGSGTPVWSPDGRQIAYRSLRNSYIGVYRQAANGEGEEERLYQHPGGSVRLTDWSLDGRFLSFFSSNDFGGTLYALPIGGDAESAPIVLFRSDSWLLGSSFSADGRFLSYTSEQSGRFEVYVRPVDSSAGAGTSSAGPWQISDDGGRALFAGWGRNGREIYYVAPDGGVMAVEASTGSTLEFGSPRLLFRPSEAVPVFIDVANVSRDGERIVIAIPHAPTLQQITVFDRQGKVVRQVGEPGHYRDPALSPDGSKVAVARATTNDDNWDIWTFDIASGAGTPLTNDPPHWKDDPVWSPDGNDLAYQSRRGIFTGIYRRASNGTGDEEQLFQYTPGAFLNVADWSTDGRFITFHDGCWGVLYVLPVSGDEESRAREAMEWHREDYLVAQPRFSPDSRFIAYISDEIEVDVFQVYVGPFDPAQPDGGRGSAAPVQVSHDGTLGMISWRQDGRELYYLTPDWEVMAVEVTTTPTFEAGTPRLLFRLPGPLPGDPVRWRNVSPDGERFVFAIDVPVSPY